MPHSEIALGRFMEQILPGQVSFTTRIESSPASPWWYRGPTRPRASDRHARAILFDVAEHVGRIGRRSFTGPAASVLRTNGTIA